MELPLKYGSTTQRLRLAPNVRAAVLAPPRTAAGESDPVGAALREPIGSPRLSRLVRPGQRVVIVTADITRPCPSARRSSGACAASIRIRRMWSESA